MAPGDSLAEREDPDCNLQGDRSCWEVADPAGRGSSSLGERITQGVWPGVDTCREHIPQRTQAGHLGVWPVTCALAC